MTKQGKEYFDGFIQGLIKTSVISEFNVQVSYLLPIDIKLTIVKSSEGFSGKYTVESHATILSPTIANTQWPGVFAFFPRKLTGFPASPHMAHFHMLTHQSIVATKIKHSGELEVVKFGNNKITIRLPDFPQYFNITASGNAEYRTPTGSQIITHYVPLFAMEAVPIEFFSRASDHHLKEITLYYHHKSLAFRKHLQYSTRTNRIPNETATLQAHAMIVKTESFYSVVDTEGEHYVEQVPELEEVRQIFLDNPELVSEIEETARTEIEDGLREGLYSTKLVKMLESIGDKGDGSGESSPSSRVGEIARRLQESRDLGPRPRKGLVYALENLVRVGKGGNYCMVVVDGCWINFRYKKRDKVLYFQVSGDQYIPEKSHFQDDHIKILEELGVQAEEMSNDIYSRTFKQPDDFDEIVGGVFRIFNDVYRVDDGSSAYIEYVLGSKESPEFREVYGGLQYFIPKRVGRDKYKYKWKWMS